jgi:Kef-type K+ transport system membrane component KefB
VAAGSLVPAALAGCLLAGWVILDDNPSVRGHAPGTAFVLLLAVSLSITALPVLARVLTERNMLETTAGQLSLYTAIVIDIFSWLMLSIIVAARSGTESGFWRSIVALLAGVAFSLATRWALRSTALTRHGDRAPRSAAALLGVLALTLAFVFERLGLTAVIGAVMLGFAVPAGETGPWQTAAARVTRAGRALVPAFFVVTGITVFTAAIDAVPWTLIAVATVLAILGKVGGGYLGAGLAGLGTHDRLRTAVLTNTRGLTELIVLKAGYSAKILTAPLFLALVVMAVITTAMTGPSLLLIERRVKSPAKLHGLVGNSTPAGVDSQTEESHLEISPQR